MSARRFSLLVILLPVLFAAKCRKDKEVEDDGEGIEIAPPEATLQITTIDPDRPEPDKAFRATIYGSGFQDGAEVWVGQDAVNTVVFRDENTLVASIPGLSVGGHDVRVRNPDGASATLRAGIIVRNAVVTIPPQCRSLRIGFDSDSHGINDAARQTLGGASACFELANVEVRIEGHADERGTTDYNLALGQRRADAVKRYIVNQGVTPSRVSTVSYGEEKPLEYGHSEQAWSANRRAEILISE